MYDLLPSDDETMIATSVREFLEAELAIERLRPGAKPVESGTVWQRMADLGWFGAGLPESAGGLGMSISAELLIQRECGRYLVSPNVLATTLAGHVAHHAGDGALAASLASGTVTAALAMDAAPSADGGRRDVLAIDRAGAQMLLYWSDSGMGLFVLPEMAKAPCIDDTLTLHVGELLRSSASHWVDTAIAPLPLRAEVMLAAALAGLAGKACDLAVEYAKIREQFGKAIGSFQAIKHRCADMAVRQRLAWYQCCLAALKLKANAPDAAMQVASAKLLAAEAAHENGRACIQIHGGIGFQAACDAHWFVKRAAIYDQAGGSMQLQAERVIAAPRLEW
jgi:alkylation response protein AidB-like acyl-CoA dehydrogenase